MELGERKKAILRAIIDDYIQTAEPVGSRTIAKKHEMGLSPATIRNEMADLEELGYLEQPHTSAGRIPSDKGYRLYVDELMEVGYPTREEIEAIKGMLQLATIYEVDKIIRRVTKLISEVTNYTSAVLSPSVKKSKVMSIQLIQVSLTELVAVVVTDTAIIKNVVIKLPRPISGDTTVKINNMLNEKLCGLTIQDIGLEVISSIQMEMAGYNEIFNAIIPVLYESLRDAQSEVYLEGTTNIFQHPEYNDIDKAKNFLSLIEQKDVLREIFFEEGESLVISIGKENEIKEIKDCSVIKASYKISNKNVGTIGVIGPTRMDYGRVIGILKSLSDILNKMLKNSFED
jgi:heat-inducible transcriptional repressor